MDILLDINLVGCGVIQGSCSPFHSVWIAEAEDDSCDGHTQSGIRSHFLPLVVKPGSRISNATQTVFSTCRMGSA
eukprot:22456-Hanusia_phi.AAC.3